MNNKERENLEYNLLEFLYTQNKYVTTSLILIEFRQKASDNNVFGILINLRNDGYLAEYDMGYEITDAGRHKYEILKKGVEKAQQIEKLEIQKLVDEVSIIGFNKRTMRITFFISILALIISVLAIIVEIKKN